MKTSQKVLLFALVIIGLLVGQIPKTKVFQCSRLFHQFDETKELVGNNAVKILDYATEMRDILIQTKDVQQIKQLHPEFEIYANELKTGLDQRIKAVNELNLTHDYLISVKEAHLKNLEAYQDNMNDYEKDWDIFLKSTDLQNTIFVDENKKFADNYRQIYKDDKQVLLDLAKYCNT